MATAADRFNDPEYVNWLRSTAALMYMKEGLEEFTINQSVLFHKELINETTLVRKQQQMALGQSCKGNCSFTDIRKDIRRKKWYMHCPVCDSWLQSAILYHRNAPFPILSPVNTHPQRWQTEPWETMKLFMPYGCETQRSAKDADLYGILCLFINCKHFLSCGSIGRQDLLQEIVGIRNSLVHSGTLKVNNTDSKRYLQTLLAFMKGITGLKCNENESVQLAIDKIQELETNLIEISLNKELELRTLQRMQIELDRNLRTLVDARKKDRNDQLTEMKDHKMMLHELKDAIQKFDEFLEQNDLINSLSNLSKKVEYTDTTFAKHAKSVADIDEKVADHERQVKYIDQRVEEQEHRVTNINQTVTEHAKRVDSIDRKFLENELKVAETDQVLTEHAERLDYTDHTVVQHEYRVADIAQRVTEHKELLENIDQTVAEYAKRVDDIDRTAAQLESSITDINWRVSQNAAKTELIDQQGLILIKQSEKLKDIDFTLPVLKQDIDNNAAKMTDIDQLVAIHENRMRQLEQKLELKKGVNLFEKNREMFVPMQHMIAFPVRRSRNTNQKVQANTDSSECIDVDQCSAHANDTEIPSRTVDTQEDGNIQANTDSSECIVVDQCSAQANDTEIPPRTVDTQEDGNVQANTDSSECIVVDQCNAQANDTDISSRTVDTQEGGNVQANTDSPECIDVDQCSAHANDTEILSRTVDTQEDGNVQANTDSSECIVVDQCNAQANNTEIPPRTVDTQEDGNHLTNQLCSTLNTESPTRTPWQTSRCSETESNEVEQLKEVVESIDERVKKLERIHTPQTDKQTGNASAEVHYEGNGSVDRPGSEQSRSSAVQQRPTSKPTMSTDAQNNTTNYMAKLTTPSIDGRIKTLTPSDIEDMMRHATELATGAYGETYLVNGDKDFPSYRFVIKQICCRDELAKRKSAINEMLASRLKHHGIVPLQAMTWDKENEIYYFTMPYMENGDLMKAIKDDHIRFIGKEGLVLRKQIRFRILYQLASVIEFLQRTVKKFRGPYVHGDITTRNIVLDTLYNIRLLDFGLSKEIKGYTEGSTRKSTDIEGTSGYRPRAVSDRVEETRDIFSYGVVARELLTGHPSVKEDGSYLFEEKNILKKKEYAQEITYIWGQDATDRTINTIAMDCFKKENTATVDSIKEKLSHWLHRKKVELFGYSSEDEEKCTLCMSNRTVKSNILNHVCELRVCVVCLRSSYLNAIICPFCNKEIPSSIGVRSGAILIAGNDTNDSELAKSFEADIKRVAHAITDERRLSMGLCSNDVKVVRAKHAGKTDKMWSKVREAFDNLSRKEHINTLLIYFSGHSNRRGELVLGNGKETMMESEIKDRLKYFSSLKTLNVILDCCFPNESFDYQASSNTDMSGLTTTRITACNSNQTSTGDRRNGSEFTNLFLQCLSGAKGKETCELKLKAKCKICRDDNLLQKCCDGFISLEYLIEYIESHMQKSGYNLPTYSITNAQTRQSKLAYFIPNIPRIQIFDERDEVHEFEEFPETVDGFLDQMRNASKKNCQKGGVEHMRMEYFKKIYCIAIKTVIKTGSGCHEQKELLTVQQIESAWNGLRSLYVLPRIIEQIDVNMSVGIFLNTTTATCTSIVECIEQLWKTKCNDIKLHDDAKEFDIPVRELDKELDDEDDMCDTHMLLEEMALGSIIKNEKFKNTDYRLALTFPFKDATQKDIEEEFFYIRIKENL